MNAVEVGKLLAEVSVIDARQVDEAAVLVWMPLVGDLDYAMSVEALRLHRRESTAYLTPAHIRANVERMLLASLGERRDEWGNRIEPDAVALAAYRRAVAGRGEIER